MTPAELAQLLEPQLSGPSHRFMSGGLGILDLDAGKYVFTCTGEIDLLLDQLRERIVGKLGPNTRVRLI